MLRAVWVYTVSMTIRYSLPVDVMDPGTFVEGVLETLRYWRDIHTHAPSWAKSWVEHLEGETNISLKDINCENGYFSYPKSDLKEDIINIMKELNAFAGMREFYCPNCGCEQDESSECEECGEETYNQLDVETLVECHDWDALEYDHILRAFERFVFPVYQEALEYVICDVLENVNHYINKIESAESKFDKLTACIQALSIAHVNGEIFDDYLHYGTTNLTFEEVLDARENGISALYDTKELKEYLDS